MSGNRLEKGEVASEFGALRGGDANEGPSVESKETTPPKTPEEIEAERHAWQESFDNGDWDPDDFDF